MRFDVDNWSWYGSIRPIRVYDGATSSSPLLGTFGGRQLPNTIFSFTNSLFVAFDSNRNFHNMNLRGFEIKYTALEFNYGKIFRERLNKLNVHYYDVKAK